MLDCMNMIECTVPID